MLEIFRSPDQRWRIRLATGAPILALVAVVVLFAFGLLWNFARQQDRAFIDTTTRLVESALATRLDATVGISVDYALWNDAYVATGRRLDLTWLERNFYSNAADALFIVDGEGAILYAWTSSVTSVEALQDQAARLPSALNAASLLDATDAGAMSASTIALAGDAPAFVAVTPISPERNGVIVARDPTRPARYLAAFDLLSNDELTALGSSLQIKGLHFEPAATASAHASEHADALRLPLGDNASLGAIAWSRQTPGADALAGQLGASIVVLLLLGSAAFALATRLANMHLAADARTRAAEEAGRLRAAFAAEVTEQVNAPLNALVGYSELIEEQADDLGAEADNIREDARKLRAAANELSTLLRGVIRHTRIDGGRVTLVSERMETAALLEEMRELTEPTAHQSGARISVTIDDDANEITGDAVRLQQCLVQLCLNALRRTPGAEVSVRVRHLILNGANNICFDFIDGGCRVEMDDAKGALGLSTARGLAQLMGGDVRVDNRSGGGAVFSLLVPAPASTTQSAHTRRRAI